MGRSESLQGNSRWFPMCLYGNLGYVFCVCMYSEWLLVVAMQLMVF